MQNAMIIDELLLRNLSRRAENIARGRTHFNIHADYADPCQRLLNIIEPGSYIRPHRHFTAKKSETLIVVRGQFGYLEFDDRGAVVTKELISSEKYGTNTGVHVKHNVWHTVISLRPGSALFEVKEGPFDPNQAKEFPHWCPEEGTPHVAEYLSTLRSIFKNIETGDQ